MQRCKEVNPVINAIVENRFEDAIQEAREIDSFLQSTTIDEAKIASEKPLLGLPVTIKESIAVQGKSHISISSHFKYIHLRLIKLTPYILYFDLENINYEKSLNKNIKFFCVHA